MSAYGNYATLCPQTFTTASLQKNFPNSTEPPFTIITEWGPTSLGMTGYNVVVPEMNKTVMVFSGVFGWQSFNATPVPMPLVDCPDCTVHADAWNTFLEAKALTNNWADVQTVEAYNGHIWSVTGHGFGGMVAQIAAVQLGYQGLAHAVHSFGAARVFNKASADLYNKLFEGESGSRTVANEDSEVAWIPESQSYTMVEQGFHVWGTNSTYGQNYKSCGFNNLDPDCLGGDNEADHYFYYTEIGHCGEDYALDQYNPALESQDLASELSAYSATNTVPLPASFTLSTSTTTTTTTTATTTGTPTTATSGRTTTLVSSSATATGSQGSTSGGIKLVSSGVIAIVGALLVGVAGALAL